ncbi:MAG: prephenate dehydrogenase/arogenate dehydrogenase family protein [Methanocalculus sp. MSAO_Arc1]|uniref:prephenate dehydrogenase/arogenate dehydrogenase family protein n=1 Tax=Methanocalculus sp. MSAO_Arc1 TaxID=2293854 RepID=UPI000FED027B|nr:prephenate dehydrogenase/arogenate dehydrogenase family protein [Methanocalculus sp. MSAO_Arc1]RQD79389.1 MAG: prephenate dehydrogenase/arogenate dehydrogenase family protein [Methanocalculus sp. MSAO_Arc1]
MRPSLRDDGKNVVIIGGTGQMGRLFQAIFEEAGCLVEVTGRASAEEYRALAQAAGVVLVTVPIQATEAVIRDIAPVLKPDQLIADLTSLKVMPVAAMMESDAQVIGLHPLFGPNMATLRGQKMIMTPVRADDRTHAWLSGICMAAGMHLHETSPEEHDRAMAIMQGLVHVQSISLAHTLRIMNLRIPDLLPFATPNAHASLAFMARTLAQDPDLYGGMLLGNPDLDLVIRTYISSMKEIGDCIRDKGEEEFRQEFEADSTFVLPMQKDAIPLTNKLLDLVVEEW